MLSKLTNLTSSNGFQNFREALRTILTNPICERFIIGIIVLNAITLGLETSPTAMAWGGTLLQVIDSMILVIFVIEILARIIAFGGQFWRDPWSLFDFAVVAVTIAPVSGNLSILRALRIIRALRLVSAVPSVRRVVGGLLAAIPSMGSVILLLLLVNYVFAVMGTKLYAEKFPNEFGTIGASFFTFFQIMTLEGWAGDIVRPVMKEFPSAWALFIPYIVIVVFAVLNLFIGIVVDAMQQQSDDARDAVIEVEKSDHQQLLAEVRALRTEIQGLRSETLMARQQSYNS